MENSFRRADPTSGNLVTTHTDSACVGYGARAVSVTNLRVAAGGGARAVSVANQTDLFFVPLDS